MIHPWYTPMSGTDGQDAAEKWPWAPSASGRWSLIFSLLPLLCWWLVGTAFGRVHEGGKGLTGGNGMGDIAIE